MSRNCLIRRSYHLRLDDSRSCQFCVYFHSVPDHYFDCTKHLEAHNGKEVNTCCKDFSRYNQLTLFDIL